MFSFELIILLLGLQAGLIYFKESRTFPSNSLRRPLRSILICDSIVFPLMYAICCLILASAERFDTVLSP
jgi:hypothetical protein